MQHLAEATLTSCSNQQPYPEEKFFLERFLWWRMAILGFLHMFSMYYDPLQLAMHPPPSGRTHDRVLLEQHEAESPYIL